MQQSNRDRFQSMAPTDVSHNTSHSSFKYANGQKKVLPPHVEEVLHAQPASALRQVSMSGQGLYAPSTLLPSLDRKSRFLPWDRPESSGKQHSTTDTAPNDVATVNKPTFGRPRRATQHSSQVECDSRYLKLFEIIDSNPHGKIVFTNSNEPMQPIAHWVTHRLENSCSSARFALPSDYRTLEDLTPLEYLEKYTILNHGQRRRYNLIYTKYMDRTEKVLLFERLYPALNSMFADSLGTDNFDVLCKALFLGDDMKISSKELFAGICAFTERLFWSSYIEGQENTFFLLGDNRSLLECADFSGLKWKLEDLDISLEMRTLLFSLA